MASNIGPWLKRLSARLRRSARSATGRCGLRLADYVPRSELVTTVTAVGRPKYPVIDAHNHLVKEFEGRALSRPVADFLADMDAAGVEMLVDLDGGWGEKILDRHLAHFKQAAPDRFQVFGGVDWARWREEGNRFGEMSARRLERQLERGAQGLKIWKSLGLNVGDERGRRVPIDDPRLDALWAVAAERRIPVMVHIADPVAFFRPVDGTNERYEELCGGTGSSLNDPKYPTFDTLVAEFRRLVERHPRTTFVGAHVGCFAENLAWVADVLRACPNLYVDISARIAELGRQPYTARRFFIEFQDRVLFGTDMMTDPRWYRIYYRFLETEDEYFDYSFARVPLQGRWRICGLFLPDEVLEKVYRKNALGILAAN